MMGPDDVLKIAVLNPKGGCGKTTLATNLAALYAARGWLPTLLDLDPQGFGARWVERRPNALPEIHGIAANRQKETPRSLDSRCRVAIFDLPAALPHDELHAYTYAADSVLIPVMPSAIDVHSAARLIAELLLDQQLDRRDHKLAIVANRVRKNTRSFVMLTRFLSSLKIPLISVLRDSQNYVYAASQGRGICDLPPYRRREDMTQISAVLDWLDDRQEARLRDIEIGQDFQHLMDDELEPLRESPPAVDSH